MCARAQVFLQHLSPLLSLPTFAALWLTILDFMDKYMHAGSSDLLVRNTHIVVLYCCFDLVLGCIVLLTDACVPLTGAVL